MRNGTRPTVGYLCINLLAVYFAVMQSYFAARGQLIIPAAFAVCWLVVLGIGKPCWKTYSDAFPAQHRPRERSYRMVRAIVGGWPISVYATACDESIWLQAPWIFRPFHPPIQIPMAKALIEKAESTRTVLTILDPPVPLQQIIILGDLTVASTESVAEK